MTLNAQQCSKFVPDRWKTEGIPSAAIPTEGTDRALAAFGIAQTGQLDKANERTFDTIEIIVDCETEYAAAKAKIEKSWYEVWK